MHTIFSTDSPHLLSPLSPHVSSAVQSERWCRNESVFCTEWAHCPSVPRLAWLAARLRRCPVNEAKGCRKRIVHPVLPAPPQSAVCNHAIKHTACSSHAWGHPSRCYLKQHNDNFLYFWIVHASFMYRSVGLLHLVFDFSCPTLSAAKESIH